MKWRSWYPANEGDKRIATHFAYLPVKIGNDCRWLEFVDIEYEHVCSKSSVYWRGKYQGESTYFYWKKVRFVDSKGSVYD